MIPNIDFLASSLLCVEDNNCLCYDDEDYDFDNNRSYTFVNHFKTEHSVLDIPLQTDECLNLLIEKEREQFDAFIDYLYKLKNGKLDLVARQEAIDWITMVHAHFNFRPLSAILAIYYLDRFLAVYELPAKDWMMQLLAVACLSLAAKIEETEVPLVLDLQVGGARFILEAKTIQKMELLVLTTLKWRMQAVTPFSFLDDFLVKVKGGQPTSKSLILTSTQLILCLIRGIEFLEFKPSEIAAAVAIHVVGMGSSKMSALVQYVKKKSVLKCLELLKELNGDCTRSLMSGTFTSMPKSPIGVLEAACFSSKTDDSTKRRLNNTSFELKI